MDWQMVLLLNVGIFALAQILIKLIVSKLPRAQALSLQFLIILLIMSGYAMVTGEFHLSKEMMKVAPAGFFVAFGTYCQWRAINISLSRTTLFLPLSGALTFILASIFLEEAKEWNIGIISGAGLCFLAIFLFRFQSMKDSAKGDQGKWFLFMTGMILIVGLDEFLMKIFSFDIPRGNFLFYRYVGMFLGTLPLLALEKQNPLKWPGKLIFLIPLASLVILANMATLYWGFQLTLASRVVPFRMVAITFLPVLIGWFLFKERKGLTKKELLAFAIGIIGDLLIILS